MEVQPISKASVARIGLKETTVKDSISFNSVIDKKRTEQTIESLDQKIQEIESHGSKLVESRTVENLRKYKKLVKDFMNDVVKNGLQLKQQHGFNQQGYAKINRLVKEVDKKLVDVTNAVLDKEQKGLDLLGMVGEIKGMLINLYT